MICVACWAAALVTPATFIYLVTSKDSNYHPYSSHHCDSLVMTNTRHWLRPALAVVFLFLPNCVVVANTVNLLIIAKRVALRSRENLKWEGIITTILIATVYCLSSLPAAVNNILGHGFSHAQVYSRIAVSCLFINTISNFYIYCLSVKGFRDFIRSTLQQPYRFLSNIMTCSTRGKGIDSNKFDIDKYQGTWIK